MTRQLTPLTLPISGVTVMVIPVSVSAETMLSRRQFKEPPAPVVSVAIAGIKTTERNPSDPNYKIAYEKWESMLQIEITERVLRQIAMVQTLSSDDKKQVDELREMIGDIEQLPKSDKFLWLMKIAIASDKDIQAIIRKTAALADPQEDGIKEEIAGF